MESQDLVWTMCLIAIFGYMIMAKQDDQTRRLRRLERMLRSVPGAGEADEELHPKVIASISKGKINAAIVLHHTIATVSLAEAQAAVRSYVARQDESDGTLSAESRATNSSAGTGLLKK